MHEKCQLKFISAGTGIKINKKNTEVMRINAKANIPITVSREPVKEVDSFL